VCSSDLYPGMAIPPVKPADDKTPEFIAKQALASFCQALFSSNRFLYID